MLAHSRKTCDLVYCKMGVTYCVNPIIMLKIQAMVEFYHPILLAYFELKCCISVGALLYLHMISENAVTLKMAMEIFNLP